MNPTSHRNRLASESSLYLQQHASNPVDWYPWGDEALGLARTLDRPILLSIGYSACHWCHVMERECFENEEIAALMNERFVCIKVDREERPDLDHLYMKALQGMTGRGGWPMTVFLTPDGRPYYAGTYFPPEDRNGMPGFPRVLIGVSTAWAEQRDAVLDSADRVGAFLREDAQEGAGESSLNEARFLEAAGLLLESMDSEHGGFGKAPKFPASMALTLLLDAEVLEPNEDRRRLLQLTLGRMAAGGIRDHLGGGFHRYSVDGVWLVPHFEKMLYDQALLAKLYLNAARYFDEPVYAEVAAEIFEYVLREMTSGEGGFHATQDADSEGEEGKFFVWSKAEIENVLGGDRARLFCRAYDVSEAGNFEGHNILQRILPRGELGKGGAEAELAECRAMLFRHRVGRVAPGRDDKVVADWNGLMISALALGGRVLDQPHWILAAERAADFVRGAMMNADGLRHVYAGGVAKVPAFLDDYAFFGRGCLDLFEASGRESDLGAALFCAGRLLDEFRHESGQGFCFTSATGEHLIARTRDLFDGAVPAGNSVAAELLLRLWALTGEEEYLEAGEGVLGRFVGEALANPYGGSHLLAIAERHRRGWRTVVLVGEPDRCERLAAVARKTYDPGRMVFRVADPSAEWLPSALRGKMDRPGQALAYVCVGSTCSVPLAGEEELEKFLNGPDATGGRG